MGKIKTYNFTGNCPHTGSKQSIKIDYFEIPIAGRMTPDYKKSAYSCQLCNECPYPSQEKYGRCPVYMDAPDVPC